MTSSSESFASTPAMPTRASWMSLVPRSGASSPTSTIPRSALPGRPVPRRGPRYALDARPHPRDAGAVLADAAPRQGGIGLVWLASDSVLGRGVALKEL